MIGVIHSTVRSARCSAIDLGTISPKTMCAYVRMATATMLASVWAAMKRATPRPSSRGTSRSATWCSLYMPRPRLASVIPSCAVAMKRSCRTGSSSTSRTRLAEQLAGHGALLDRHPRRADDGELRRYEQAVEQHQDRHHDDQRGHARDLVARGALMRSVDCVNSSGVGPSSDDRMSSSVTMPTTCWCRPARSPGGSVAREARRADGRRSCPDRRSAPAGASRAATAPAGPPRGAPAAAWCSGSRRRCRACR